MRGWDISKKEQLSYIRKKPPILLFTCDCPMSGSSLLYLRGLLKEEEAQLVDNLNIPSICDDFIHLFYPVSKRLTINPKDIESWVRTLAKELEVRLEDILDLALSLPCFYLDPHLLKKMNHMIIHRSLARDIQERTSDINTAYMH